MNKVKETYTKFKTWHQTPTEFTNGDGLIMWILLIGMVLR